MRVYLSLCLLLLECTKTRSPHLSCWIRDLLPICVYIYWIFSGLSYFQAWSLLVDILINVSCVLFQITRRRSGLQMSLSMTDFRSQIGQTLCSVVYICKQYIHILGFNFLFVDYVRKHLFILLLAICNISMLNKLFHLCVCFSVQSDDVALQAIDKETV